jgi:hypothetical protein
VETRRTASAPRVAAPAAATAAAEPPAAPPPAVLDVSTAEGRRQAETVWVQTRGLTVSQEAVSDLQQRLGSRGLEQIRLHFTQAALESLPPEQLARQFGAFVSHAGPSLGSNFDVNALVEMVLREAYMQNTLDLAFYAEKVKFFNACKKKIRDEATRARKELSKYAGKPDETRLEPPFVHQEVNVEYAGQLEPGYLPTNQQAVQAYTTAQAAFTAAYNKAATGGGVHLASEAEKAKLNPPASGDVFITADGYRVDVNGSEVTIYKRKDDGTYEKKTRIWGDPHVDESATGGGDDWHFGDDSTFILPDGTKVCLNTEETSPGSGIFVVKGVDILSGDDHAFTGLSPEGQTRPAGADTNRLEWDAQHGDTAGGSGGVFALGENGQWSMLGPDGKFRDVSHESWEGYLSSKDVTTQGGALTASTTVQNAAEEEAAARAVSSRTARDTAGAEAGKYASLTKGELDAYIKSTEEKLASVGDDAQLANVDLQNMLQKQQQTLQTMSNISKMLHDTAMAVIRKIGG